MVYRWKVLNGRKSFWSDQHVSFWYSGRNDRDPGCSYCVPEAYFGHPENLWINERIWGQSKRNPSVSLRIRELADYLKQTLYRFVDITKLICWSRKTFWRFRCMCRWALL